MVRQIEFIVVMIQRLILLMEMDSHTIEKRGFIDVKGLGSMETYWINDMSASHKEKSSLNVPAIIEKCKVIIELISDENVGRFPHLMAFHEEDISSRSLNRTISNSNFSKSADCLTPNTTLSQDGLNLLIICDVSCIRLGILHLLKNSVTIKSNIVTADGKDAIAKLNSRINIFDIIVIEYNFLQLLEKNINEELLSQISRRKALNFLIVPDSDSLEYRSPNEYSSIFNCIHSHCLQLDN